MKEDHTATSKSGSRSPLVSWLLAALVGGGCGAPVGVSSDASVPSVRDGPLPADAGPPRALRDPLPSDGSPWRLSRAGLYADIERELIGAGIVEFAPAHSLWSDGADKRRWIELPPETVIDTSDMDHWLFPVGTRLWKEFSRGGVKLETRLIERTGPGDSDYWMGAFLWDSGGKDATFVEDGAANVLGTDHDVPAAKLCWSCHLGEPGRVLGFSAIQLSGSAPSALGLASLVTANLLSQPPSEGASFAPPGSELEAAALGYLHANCGSCHSHTGVARRDTDHILRLSVGERAPEATQIYKSSIGVKVQRFQEPGFAFRVVAGDPAASALLSRMRRRDKDVQMPPVASKQVDWLGVSLIERWISSLAP